MSPPKLIDGKYVLLVVLAVGLAGSGGGWWYHQSLQRRPLQLWRGEAAGLFLQAPRVELWQVEKVNPPASPPHQLTTANGDAYRVLKRTNVSRAPGFLHLRHSLLNHYSFNWSDAADGERDWRYALRFVDGVRAATLLVSADFQYAMLAESGAAASIRPIAGGVELLLNEQLNDNVPGSNNESDS